MAAVGLEQLAHGQPAEALERLSRAQEAAPDCPSINRDLAIAYAQNGQAEIALAFAERAIALGETEPLVHELRAMLLSALDRSEEAIEAAREAGTWEAALLGVSAGDLGALDRAATYVNEATPRGALSALVLAAEAGGRGARTSARTLALLAETNGEKARATDTVRAARDFQERLDTGGAWISGGARLRTSFDFATNPYFQPDGANGPGPTQDGLRFTVLGEGAIQAPIGKSRLDASLQVEQQAFVYHASELEDLDLTGFAIGASVEVPINDGPLPVLLAVAARYRDVFGRALAVHYAASVEGGPDLTIPFDANTAVVLGMYGTATDFVDRSPPDHVVSSQNRDRIGQRAVAALVFRTALLDGRLESMFIRDDARGAAFSSRGGALAGRVRMTLPAGIALSTGLAVTVRQYGPVGDEAILGAASKRTEARILAELGVRVPIVEPFAFLVENVWVRNSARDQHAYTENVTSFGLEATW
jgi:hypothetical protein